jgi:uracil-DNA glycosylase family 4
MAEDQRKNFLKLLEDIREQMFFARELGIINLETKFAAEIFEKSSPKPEKFTAPRTISETETYKPQISSAAQKNNLPQFTQKQRGSLSSLLEQTKLSKISPVAGNNAAPSQNLESRGEQSMETSLFGDLTPEKEALPASNETPEEIRADIGDCVRCPLCAARTKIVHTTGNWNSRILFVGEAPGADEDASGLPFVGRAGQLLTKIIEAIGLKREEVLIGNVNRCRPPQNRTPTIQEARTCRQFLLREIAFARPEIIVVMGNTACQNLLDTKEGISKLRGHFQDYYGIKVMPTFHPAYLLRDPSKKRETWEDMKKVRDELARAAK